MERISAISSIFLFLKTNWPEFPEKLLKKWAPFWEVAYCSQAGFLKFQGEHWDGWFWIRQGNLLYHSVAGTKKLAVGKLYSPPWRGEESIYGQPGCEILYLNQSNWFSFCKSHPQYVELIHRKYPSFPLPKGATKGKGITLYKGWTKYLGAAVFSLLLLAFGSLLPLIKNFPFSDNPIYGWFWIASSFFSYSIFCLVAGQSNITLFQDHLSLKQFKLFPLGIDNWKIHYEDLQSYEIHYSRFFSRIFRLGSLIIRTGVHGRNLEFSPVYKGEEFIKKVQENKQKWEGNRGSVEQVHLRKAVEDHLNLPATWEFRNFAFSSKIPKESWFRSKIPGPLMKSEGLFIIPWRQVLPYGGLRFRRHSILFWIKGFPFLLLSITAFILPRFFPALGALPLLLLVFLFPLWYIWEDWRNDCFEVNSHKILDLDRKPLYLKESRKEAPLDQIVHVEVRKKGILSFLFDFGDVKMETGGDGGNLCFEGVPHPDRVQDEIMRFKRDLQHLRDKEVIRQRQGEYPMLLQIYRQLLEEGRFSKANTIH